MRASDRAYRVLLDEIQSGALQPATVLGEVEQSTRLGVSRTPLREAIARLAADGLVVQASPRVTVVSDLDTGDIRELFEVRRALEETAARLAAQRGETAAFGALAAEFADTDAAADPDAYYALIARFDAALDAAVANDYLTAALKNVRTHLVRVRRLARDNPQRLAASAAEHRVIADAISAGDSDLAAHATHVHLHNALGAILASLDAGVSSRFARSTTGGVRGAVATTGGARGAVATTGVASHAAATTGGARGAAATTGGASHAAATTERATP